MAPSVVPLLNLSKLRREGTFGRELTFRWIFEYVLWMRNYVNFTERNIRRSLGLRIIFMLLLRVGLMNGAVEGNPGRRWWLKEHWMTWSVWKGFIGRWKATWMVVVKNISTNSEASLDPQQAAPEILSAVRSRYRRWLWNGSLRGGSCLFFWTKCDTKLND